MKGHKSHHHKKANGGKVRFEETGTEEEDKEVESKKDAFKHGGKVKHKKHGGKVEGKKAHKHAGKKMRSGGKVDMAKNAVGATPTSPLTGAGKTAEPKIEKKDREED